MTPWQNKPLCIMLCISIFLLLCSPLHADQIDEQMARMTLPQRIGQIMMIGIQGQSIDAKDAARIKKIDPGGLVLYGRNFREAQDIARLITQIRSVPTGSRLPMFFAMDQEGGIVHRIRDEFYMPPSAPAIASTGSERFAYDVALAVGSALRELGININLAPVLDVPSDLLSSPMTFRSFSNDPEEVAGFGTSYIRGLKEAGLLATAKHFPNLGRTLSDSHLGLPRMKWGSSEERDRDILPFKRAIGEGVDLIMTGHVIAEPGDGNNPVSLSSYWLNDVLRGELGFEGLVVGDDLEMKAVAVSTPVPAAAVRSFNAGADIIMVSHESKKQEEVFRSLMDAVKKGIITEARLNSSLKRIIETKNKILPKNKPGGAKEALKDLSAAAAEMYVTALQATDSPSYSAGAEEKILFAGYNLALLDEVRKNFSRTSVMNYPIKNLGLLNPGSSTEEFIKRFDAVIIDASYGDAAWVISVCERLGIRYFLVQSQLQTALRTIERLRPKQMILAHEINRMNYRVALEIIRGARKAAGRLPINLPLPAKYIYKPKDM